MTKLSKGPEKRHFLIIPDSDIYNSLVPSNPEDWSIFDLFIGNSLADTWHPVNVEILKAKKVGDFPSLANHVPVFSVRALQVLRPLLGECIEALPLACKSHNFYAINVLEVLNCLDKGKSEITWLPSGGVMFIDRYVFKKSCIGEQHIFKLVEKVLGKPIVSETFKKIVEQANLEGLIFEEIG